MTAAKQAPEVSVADAPKGNWVDQRASPLIRPYLQLSRIDRPIGTWLLYLPCLWAIALSSGASGGSGALESGTFWQALWLVFSSGLGAVVMRGAGCTWNDIADRKIDAKVARTSLRPLPSGRVSVAGAALWMLAQLLIGALILLSYNLLALWLGVCALLLVALYPFAKRFTWWPQAFLGLTFNWGALLLWAAHSGTLNAAAYALYAAGFFWTLFYDTIYAHQDKEDDALIGVKSTARLFGAQSKIWLRRFALATFICFEAAVLLALGPSGDLLKIGIASLGVAAMGGHMAWQMHRLDIDDAQSCLALFRSNRDAGILAALFFAGALLI